MRQETLIPKMRHTIRQFTAACSDHYAQVMNVIKEPGSIASLQPSLERINSFLPPSGYLTAFVEQLSRRHTTTKELFYGLRRENDTLAKMADSFITQHGQYRNNFYSNVQGLLRLHDELALFVQGKTLRPEARSWVEGYFRIVNNWTRQKAPSDIQALQDRIVTPILSLNETNSGSPFIFRSSEEALESRFAAHNLATLTHSCVSRLEQHAAIFKKIILVAGILDRHLAAASNELEKRSLSRVKGDDRKINRWITYLAFLSFPAAVLVLSVFIHRLPHSDLPAGFPTQALPATGQDNISTASSPAAYPWLDSVRSIYGIDISKYQGDLLQDLKDFDTLHFVICKATEGVTLTDNTFIANWERLKKEHLIRGAYHFFIYGDNPIAQARHFLRTTGTFSGAEIPLILDIEEGSFHKHAGGAPPGKDSLRSHLLTFMRYLESKTRRKPIIYTDLSFANTWLRSDSFANYPLWLAEYSGKRSPALPWAWRNKHATFWQKSSTYTIGSRKTDYDVFIGTGRELAAFINPDQR